jgi:hypothetical protein
MLTILSLILSDFGGPKIYRVDCNGANFGSLPQAPYLDMFHNSPDLEDSLIKISNCKNAPCMGMLIDSYAHVLAVNNTVLSACTPSPCQPHTKSLGAEGMAFNEHYNIDMNTCTLLEGINVNYQNSPFLPSWSLLVGLKKLHALGMDLSSFDYTVGILPDGMDEVLNS